jgi:DNA-binding transcriptional ArsR family regulator
MVDLLEVAAEPTRRRLLQRLAGGEQTVNELAAGFDVTRSAISQHLLLLAGAGLLVARKEGRNRYYALNRAGMEQLKAQMDAFWTTELDLLIADAQALGTHSHQGEP